MAGQSFSVIARAKTFAATEARRRENQVLLALLLIGALLRLRLMLDYRPIFIGYPDSGAYLFDAFAPDHPFYDPLRVTGYGTVIRTLHGITPHLFFVSIVQHALGLLTAVAFVVTLRIAGVRSRWAGVLPAAIVSLSGVVIMFEHALLTETLWMALVAFALLAVVAGARSERRAVTAGVLAICAGLLIGVSVTVRLPSVFLIPVLLLWFLLASGGGWPRRAVGTGLMLLAAIAPLLGYAEWQKHDTGRFGLTRNGVLNVYGRVAPWADCTKFTPPKGTEFLCETTPVAKRRGHEEYIFAPSPATLRYNVGRLPQVLSADGAKKIGAWSKAAILGQPFTYLEAVLRESRRIISPYAAAGMPGQGFAGYGLWPQSYDDILIAKDRDAYLLPMIGEQYGGADAMTFKRGSIKWLISWDKITRVHAFWMALLIALSLMAPFVTRGPERRLAWLLSPAALLMLEMPVVTSLYDFRYLVPVFGLLGAAASIGAWGVIASTRGWWAQRVIDAPPDAPAVVTRPKA